MASGAAPKTVRLWWRCSLCRFRLDMFGTNHDESRTAMADYAYPHLTSRHGVLPDTYAEAASYFTPDGATTRVVRKTVIVEELS